MHTCVHICTHVHVRQPRTKGRKVKEGRKKGYILETKGTPIRKEKRLGTKEGTNGELVPRKPARFTHLQAPLIGTASHSLAPHGAHTPCSDSGSQAFQMRVCHVITPATLAIPEGIPLMPAPPRCPQGCPNYSLCTETPFRCKDSLSTSPFKVPECCVQGAPWALFVGRTARERHH